MTYKQKNYYVCHATGLPQHHQPATLQQVHIPHTPSNDVKRKVRGYVLVYTCQITSYIFDAKIEYKLMDIYAIQYVSTNTP